jgi:endonuclease YncB( thermonuclease family)
MLSGRASVIDGDTIEIHGTRIRLFGIDAPESRQSCTAQDKAYRCGQQAAFALSNKIGSQAVECQPKDQDRYGRIVAVCQVGGEDINAWMVAQGWALAYRYYSSDYVSQEQDASRSKIGVWQGDFEPPWDWRHRHPHRRIQDQKKHHLIRRHENLCTQCIIAPGSLGGPATGQSKSAHKPDSGLGMLVSA